MLCVQEYGVSPDFQASPLELLVLCTFFWQEGVHTCTELLLTHHESTTFVKIIPIEWCLLTASAPQSPDLHGCLALTLLPERLQL